MMNVQALNQSYLKVLGTRPLNLATRRLFNYILHFAFENKLIPHRKEVSFTVPYSAFIGVFSVDKPQTDSLIIALQALMRIIVCMKYQGEVIYFPLLTKVSINEKKSEIQVGFSKLSQKVYSHPILLERLLIQAHFRGKYTLSLYEILAKALMIEGQKKKEIPLEELKSVFDIDAGKLTNFADLNRFALTPAIDEINLFASFHISLTPVKVGRRVEILQFDIKPIRQISLETEAKMVIPPRRPALHLTKAQAHIYESLLSAPFKKRMRSFEKACSQAQSIGKQLSADSIDMPDKWLKYLL